MWPAADPLRRLAEPLASRLLASQLLARQVLALLLLASLVPTAAARAATGTLDGPLGRWLDHTVAPQLAEALSRHPLFKGETVRFATLRGAVPQRTTSALNEAVERRLTQHLLQQEGVRLAFEQETRDCSVPRTVGYLIGIEIAPAGGREASVSIGVIDVAESVWVSGVAFQWQGPLSAAERQALHTALATTAPGTAESPLPMADAEAVAAALRSHLRCMLPGGLDGPLFVDQPEDPSLIRIALALQGRLLTSPLAAVTTDRESASWVMRLDRDSAGGEIQEVRVDLEDPDGGAGQRVAAVFVAAADVATPAAAAATPSGLPLLSELSLRQAEAVGVCDNSQARVNTCAEVEFELRSPAYLLVFSTQSGRVQGVDCRSRPDRDEPGLRRFRLRVPPGTVPPSSREVLASVGTSRRADAGLYVLATRSSQAASELHAALRNAPGACGAASASADAWLSSLERIIGQFETELTWRIMHLAHETEGVTEL